MNQRRARQFSAIEAECIHASRHHHQTEFHSLHEAYAVIAEELDEVWDICRLKKEARSRERVEKELIQVAAMAIKALDSIDNFVIPAVKAGQSP